MGADTVTGRQDASAMDVFARLGHDTWCVDMEGYGRSDKTRDIDCDTANGADDLAAATECIARTRGVEPVLMYGISSGALRAALFAQRHPIAHASLQQKNDRLVHHVLHSFFSQPAPVYRGH
jgi:pimeloyl-ACP methyl ester carboxylesterase